MNLMEQCRIWNEEDDYQKIIDAISNLDEEEQTPELISELARAYNNIANPEETHYFQKAVELLKTVEDVYALDHNWNFRIAYSYYYLDQEDKALPYFKKALDARPNDEDTLYFIENCMKILALPNFKRSFKKRVSECWDSFIQNEIHLRELMDQKNEQGIGEKLIQKCNEILSIAFEDVSFELGYNGKSYDLILTPEGDQIMLYKLVYFQQQMPSDMLNNWNIIVGREASKGFSLRAFDKNISAEDVQVWAQIADKDNPTQVDLEFYCEKLVHMLEEDEGRLWWIIANLVDQSIGEIVAMKVIQGFQILKEPKEEKGILLSDLNVELENLDITLSNDAKQFIERNYSAYQMKPVDSKDADLRFDVYTGVTRCPSLINEYLCNESNIVDTLHQDGAFAGFFYYPLANFENEESSEEYSKKILDFRDMLEEKMLEKAGSERVTFLGGATGISYGYLDFIAWDIRELCAIAQEVFFYETSLPWANVHSLRRDVKGFNIMDHEENEG